MSKIIKELYALEDSIDTHEIQSSKLTVKAPVHTVAMFNALAARFQTTRFNLIEPILKEAAEEMFAALSDKDKKELAAIADAESTELLCKSGKMEINSVGIAGEFENECSDWRERLAILDHFKKEASKK